ncbi:U3 small nucleolar ribonucleoprotein protein IMP4-like [Bolinopsis microptera]|uniref:U3 small nucleolar ribonucleoprotein protein IMP4-like n=1 Tax=Bolinopsis microptera TaxID=2820187 RepID=UPI003079E381
MIRRQTRLRREYLYRKGLEEKERATAERKAQLKVAVEEGKRIPTELKKDAINLQKQIDLDGNADTTINSIDDEYLYAGVQDPKLVLTTSHDPSSRLKQFAKEIRLILPNCQRLNRGHFVVKDLVEACKSNDVTDLVVLHEHRGVPDSIVICHLPYGPTAYFSLSNVVMRHDIPNVGPVQEVYPHLIFQNFTTKLGKRLESILKYLFPVPKPESKRVMSFVNSEDYISFRHHTYTGPDNKIELSEVGPRFEMRLFEIRQGTLEQNHTNIEWKLRPYMNTAKKRYFLGDEEEET